MPNDNDDINRGSPGADPPSTKAARVRAESERKYREYRQRKADAAKAWSRTVSWGAGLLLVAGAGWLFWSQQQASDAPQTPSTMTVPAWRLCQAYHGDDAAADATYKARSVVVSGPMRTGLVRGFNGFQEAQWPNGINCPDRSYITCPDGFPKQQLNAWDRSKHDITLKGMVLGLDPLNPASGQIVMANCEFVK
ncbi:MAG TPA: hypothetical protein VFF06_18710 [Polyangia bacterium]|nr:hypothetical protein [Polyangia bacterium]